MDDKKPIAIIAVALVVFLAGGAWWMARNTRKPPAAQNASPVAVTGTEAPIDKPSEPPVILPPLDRMDGFGPLLSARSSRPELARWPATDDLVGQPHP
jgi:hypothetical protein